MNLITSVSIHSEEKKLYIRLFLSILNYRYYIKVQPYFCAVL